MSDFALVARASDPRNEQMRKGILDTMDRYDFSKLVETTWFLGLAPRVPHVAFIDMCPGCVVAARKENLSCGN